MSKQKEEKKKKESKNLREQEEFISFDAPPLNFANVNIKNLTGNGIQFLINLDLKHAIPRQGKRKPINQIDQEDLKEDKKKNGQTEDLSQQQNQTQNQIQMQGSTEDVQDEKGEEEKEKEKREKEKRKEQRETPVVTRTIQPSNQSNIQTQQINPHQAQKGHNKINDDGNKDKINQFKVTLIQSSLVLSYNKIQHLNNFASIIDSIMYNSKQLRWIDLSHNYLETLDYNFSDFPYLKSLYLHGNYLKDLKDLQQLNVLTELRVLTVHGNPIDTIQNFRLYIIGMLPNLKKLDSVLISKKELDNTYVWKNNFCMVNPPPPKIITRPDKSQGGE